MTKNLVLGAVRGGAVSAVLGALFMVILSALDTGSMMGVMAISAAVILAPFGAGLGLLAGPKWSVLKLTVLGAAIGLGGGLFLAISLVTMSTGNWVMGLLAIGAGLIWGSIVSGIVARFGTR